MQEFQTKINKIKGQVNGIEKMILEERDYLDILTQILAVREALSSVGKSMLEEESKKCLDCEKPEEREERFKILIKNLFKL